LLAGAVDAGVAALAALFEVDLVHPLPDEEPREGGDGGIAEEIDDGELRELRGEAAVDLHDEQRMAAEIEEAVLDADHGPGEPGERADDDRRRSLRGKASCPFHVGGRVEARRSPATTL
jgi:hypothetical protein